MSSDEDKNSKKKATAMNTKQRKKLEISLFPLLPNISNINESSRKSNSENRIDRRYKGSLKSDSGTKLPKIIDRRPSKNRRQYDSDSQMSDSSDYVSYRTDDDSIYRGSYSNRSRDRYNYRQKQDASPRVIKINTDIKIKNRIRTSFNTEHEFLERELYDIKSDFKRFRKKNLKQIKNEEHEGDSFNENDFLESLKEFISDYEKKSKLKSIENDIVQKRLRITNNSFNQTYVDLLKRYVKFKTSFESKILHLSERVKDLYYEHISKCCVNFSSIDENLVKFHDANGNEIIEEENIEADNNSDNDNDGGGHNRTTRKSNHNNNYSKKNHGKNNSKKDDTKKSSRSVYLNVIYDYENLSKQFNDNTKAEIKDINRCIAKQNSYTESFYMFIRMRYNYVGLCEDIIRKNENIIRTFFEWTKQDKKFLDNLTECVDYMQRESKEKDSRRLYLQSRLHLVQKRLTKCTKEIELLKHKQLQYRRYVDQLLKRDEITEIECDRLLYKISKVNLEIKEFDETWNNTSSFTRKYEHKHQYARSKEKKLHVVLYRLHNWLDTRRSEQRKIRKTIRNVKNAIEMLDTEIQEKEKSNEPNIKDYEKYLNLNKEIAEDLNKFHNQVEQIQKARKLKLSMKSYLNLQAGLSPSVEQ